ncbi:class I SAM-dependent methyltransferase [Desulfogranum japonicum]|uniref:class I SAM-dependent methyltransferase n=1 Tax=Desulfogranum japonicum TaxID=231447 RepID=UPI0004142299|nr:Trm112 family protein [Desulfogranum japonicum]
MKKQLLEILICPKCLPDEFPLTPQIDIATQDDIEQGLLACPHCGATYPIANGIAYLDPFQDDTQIQNNKYEHDTVVSSYLWSHFSDLFDMDNASEAYATWSDLVTPVNGMGLDAGGAVGRFTFELGSKCNFALGIDNSIAFIRTARQLMLQRNITFGLKEEGYLTKEVTFTLPDHWDSTNVEFIVGNALALPVRKSTIAAFGSLNLVDKVPSPIKHLMEMDRVTRMENSQFVLSDPFSWSEEAAEIEEWLGGKIEGPYQGKGLDNIAALLSSSTDNLPSQWQIMTKGKTWWKIRTHSNHYELIQSCYLKATR